MLTCEEETNPILGGMAVSTLHNISVVPLGMFLIPGVLLPLGDKKLL